MGGFGSGRRGGKLTVEQCRALDVSRLHKAGALSPGWAGISEWTRDGKRVASIRVVGGRDRIVLSYRWRRGGAEWQDVEEPIRILWRPCRYGSERPYFQCPGVIDSVPCCRRSVKLYCVGRYYLCRTCYRLSYASRNEDRWDRALRRANKIRTKLGGEPGTSSLFPRRPKGMWSQTYDELRDRVIDDESVAEERLVFMMQRLNRAERRSDRGCGGARARKRYWQ